MLIQFYKILSDGIYARIRTGKERTTINQTCFLIIIIITIHRHKKKKTSFVIIRHLIIISSQLM